MNQYNIKLTELAAELRSNPGTSVVFYVDNIAVNPGYHVTEVKHAKVKSLDCGRGSDQWEEVVIQLLDGSADRGQTFMESSKLLAIIGAAFTLNEENSALDVFFEYAPNNGPLFKLAVESIKSSQDQITITLRSLHAVCKPMQRLSTAFSATTTAAQACCAGGGQKDASACCR